MQALADIGVCGKRKRTSYKQRRNEGWGKLFWGVVEEALADDSNELAKTLGVLADAAVAVARQELQARTYLQTSAFLLSVLGASPEQACA